MYEESEKFWTTPTFRWTTPIFSINNTGGKSSLVVSMKKWTASEAELIITHIQAWLGWGGGGAALGAVPIPTPLYILCFNYTSYCLTVYLGIPMATMDKYRGIVKQSGMHVWIVSYQVELSVSTAVITDSKFKVRFFLANLMLSAYKQLR